MAESAALLVDDVLHGYPIRQWVLGLPIPLRLSDTKPTDSWGRITDFGTGISKSSHLTYSAAMQTSMK